MEYLDKGDLHDYLSGPIPELAAREVVWQLAEGLAFMHGEGFAHRDLKPKVG